MTYWREEPLEVGAIFEGSWGSWAVEVKTSGFGSHELKGLLEFCRRNPKFRPLVITAPGDEPIARRRSILAISWREFLLSGPCRYQKLDLRRDLADLTVKLTALRYAFYRRNSFGEPTA